jgi:hypothetical protein
LVLELLVVAVVTDGVSILYNETRLSILANELLRASAAHKAFLVPWLAKRLDTVRNQWLRAARAFLGSACSAFQLHLMQAHQ